MLIPKDLTKKASVRLKQVKTESDFFKIRSEFLGKKSVIQKSFQALRKLPQSEKIKTAKKLNLIQSDLSLIFNNFANELRSTVNFQPIDISLPAFQEYGSAHPISKTIDKILAYFEHLNYQTFFGNEIETDWYNFGALNFPDDHPARQMHDTFYIDSKSKKGYLLRTHTSNTQIHSMLDQSAPIYMLSAGRVYRCDSDTTHLPMFTQIEGLAVDKDISFVDLKGIIIDFLQYFFDRKMDVRFRPSYFPFTEPSAEVDIKFGTSGWLEVLGCGMVHPNVLSTCQINPKLYSGFAFGLGVERLAMLYYGVKDIREFYASNLDFLNQV
tara:strand:- start:9295 stop:10269 length:975 start_codon:yes stop_codon:yes gene_type:complete